MTRLYANNLSTTLNGAITNVATTMTLTDVSNFPAVGGGDTAQITITDGTNTEVVTATAIAGSVVTITRAQEGTSGTAFADLDTVELRETALSFTDVLSGDTNPTLLGELDASDGAAYVGFGGSSTTTAYNLIGSGGVPRLTGAANYWYSFSSSSLYMQAGTSFNSIEFKNDSTRLVIKTNNSERMQVDDSGVNISNGDLAINTGDLVMATTTGVQDTNGNYLAKWQVLSASAVNNIEIANNSTGNAPRITAIGSDTNIDLELRGKGSGSILSVNEHLVGNTGGTQTIRIDGTATTPSIGTSTAHEMILSYNDGEVARVTSTGLKLDDSKVLTLGTGNDATIQYDGTDLLINPQVGGSGNLVLSAGNFEGAGISFDSGVTTANAFLDEDTLSSDSATAIASQQSIKAYVDDSHTYELIASATASSSSSIEFTDLSSNYFMYVLVGNKIVPGTDNVGMWLRTSTDNGATFDSGASDYGHSRFAIQLTTSPTLNTTGDGADAQYVLATGIGNATNETVDMVMNIINPSGTGFTKFQNNMTFQLSNGTHFCMLGTGVRFAASDVDAIQLLMSVGTIASGEFRLYGMKEA